MNIWGWVAAIAGGWTAVSIVTAVGWSMWRRAGGHLELVNGSTDGLAEVFDGADVLQRNVRHADGSRISRREAEGLAKLFDLMRGA